jgi:hypothetical protein
VGSSTVRKLKNLLLPLVVLLFIQFVVGASLGFRPYQHILASIDGPRCMMFRHQMHKNWQAFIDCEDREERDYAKTGIYKRNDPCDVLSAGAEGNTYYATWTLGCCWGLGLDPGGNCGPF